MNYLKKRDPKSLLNLIVYEAILLFYFGPYIEKYKPISFFYIYIGDNLLACIAFETLIFLVNITIYLYCLIEVYSCFISDNKT